jgi:hypothetical protein
MTRTDAIRPRPRHSSFRRVSQRARPKGRLSDRKPKPRKAGRAARLPHRRPRAGLCATRFRNKTDRIPDRKEPLSSRRNTARAHRPPPFSCTGTVMLSTAWWESGATISIRILILIVAPPTTFNMASRQLSRKGLFRLSALPLRRPLLVSDGAINRAIMALLDMRDPLRLPLDGSMRVIHLFDRDIRLRVESESGKANLNAAPLALLAALFRRDDQPPAPARRLALTRCDTACCRATQFFRGRTKASTASFLMRWLPNISRRDLRKNI